MLCFLNENTHYGMLWYVIDIFVRNPSLGIMFTMPKPLDESKLFCIYLLRLRLNNSG